MLNTALRKTDSTTKNTEELRAWRRHTAQMTAERQAARQREYERSIRDRDGISPGATPWQRPPSPMTPILLTLVTLIVILIAAGA